MLFLSFQALDDDRQKAEAELEHSKSVLEGERADLQRARDDLDRFSARVSRAGRGRGRANRTDFSRFCFCFCRRIVFLGYLRKKEIKGADTLFEEIKD